MKKTPLLLFGLIISVSSFSQFSVGVETGLPMSHSQDLRSFGIGGSVSYEVPFQSKLSMTCSLGYLSFFDKFRDGFPTGNKIIPIAGGVKYYFSGADKGFYATAEMALNFISYTASYPDFSSAKNKRFGCSTGIGYGTNRWDFTGRYNAIQEANYLSLRVAYRVRVK